MSNDLFRELQSALDPLAVAEQEGCGRPNRRREFNCPACGGRFKAVSKRNHKWSCVVCLEGGDVVDLLMHTRRIDKAGAIDEACRMAGIQRDPKGDRFTRSPSAPPRPPPPPKHVLTDEDRAARMRAVNLAWEHYSTLAGIRWDVDRQSPVEHLRFLSSTAPGCPGMNAKEAERTFEARETCIAYIEERGLLYPGVPDQAVDVAHDLVGVCPSWRTGLAEHLRTYGGDELVEAGVRADVLRRGKAGNLYETMRGRIVFRWEDARGRCVYLTGRAVPKLAGVCKLRGDDGEIIKATCLTGFHPDSEDGRGIPAAGAPFGYFTAMRLHRETGQPIVVVEGEVDALTLLGGGRPAVALGGTGRTSDEDIVQCLFGLPCVVMFDRDIKAKVRERTETRARQVADLLCADLVTWGAA